MSQHSGSEDRPCVVFDHILLEVTLLFLNTADLGELSLISKPVRRRYMFTWDIYAP